MITSVVRKDGAVICIHDDYCSHIEATEISLIGVCSRNGIKIVIYHNCFLWTRIWQGTSTPLRNHKVLRKMIAQ